MNDHADTLRELRRVYGSIGNDVMVHDVDQRIAALEAGRSGEAVAWGVRGNTGELWVCDFGLATIRKCDADDYAEWATRHNKDGAAPFSVVPFYAAPQQPPPVGVTDDLDVERVAEIAASLPGDDTQAHRALHSLAADLAHQRDDNRRLYRLSHQQPAPSVSEDRS